MGRLTEHDLVGQNNAEPIVTACNNCDIWKQLCEYKDLEEQGRLIELPCAVGDTVYRTNEEAIEPYPYVVFSEPFACFVKNLWGKEFFATKEEAEAEANLKELEGDKE